jgi:type II secretory pathway predicted ATPase ExeA
MSLTPAPSSLIQPFTKELDPALCYESRGHQEAMARLKLMIEHRYLGVLTGEVGGGKSMLIRRLFSTLESAVYLPVYISMGRLTPRDFYGALLSQVGVEPAYSVAKARQLWDEALHARTTLGERTLVVVIDEAHEMTESMIRELRFAVSQHMDSCSLFPLILVGQPELRKILRLKKYEATAQRIGLQYHLTSLSKEETLAYVRHQLDLSAAEGPIFAESALQCLYASSQGIPRVINLICSHVLFNATSRKQDVIEEGDIVRVLADFERQRG